MKKSQLIFLAILFIFQFGGVFVINRIFLSDIENDRDVLLKRLSADGVSTAQINAIDGVLTNTMLNVSSYVNLVALILIGANFIVAKLL